MLSERAVTAPAIIVVTAAAVLCAARSRSIHTWLLGKAHSLLSKSERPRRRWRHSAAGPALTFFLFQLTRTRGSILSARSASASRSSSRDCIRSKRLLTNRLRCDHGATLLLLRRGGGAHAARGGGATKRRRGGAADCRPAAVLAACGGRGRPKQYPPPSKRHSDVQ